MDIVDQATRSRMMSGIRNKNTRPELAIRKALHGRGYRYRLHVAALPGKPDIVLPKFRAAIFVHGCFWHGHKCHLFKIPGTRAEFWLKKFETNRLNDAKAVAELESLGWRIAVVWECAIRGKENQELTQLIDALAEWVQSTCRFREFCG